MIVSMYVTTAVDDITCQTADCTEAKMNSMH